MGEDFFTGSDWCKASEVRDLAEATANVRLGRASLPKEALEPLKRAGLIDYTTGGTRGGKAALLKPTEAFTRQVLQEFVTKTVKSLDPVVTAYYRTRPEDIYAKLGSTDKFVKGQALEAYAIHIMRLLGLRFREWRKRAQDTTGRAEIDALFTGLLGGIPTLWQVQCKNTPGGRVDLEDVSKEVGLLPITHATHILIIANAVFTRDAKAYAMRVMRGSSVTVFLLGKTEFEAVRASPWRLGGILRDMAEQIIQSRAEASVWSRGK